MYLYGELETHRHNSDTFYGDTMDPPSLHT